MNTPAFTEDSNEKNSYSTYSTLFANETSWRKLKRFFFQLNRSIQLGRLGLGPALELQLQEEEPAELAEGFLS